MVLKANKFASQAERAKKAQTQYRIGVTGRMVRDWGHGPLAPLTYSLMTKQAPCVVIYLCLSPYRSRCTAINSLLRFVTVRSFHAL